MRRIASVVTLALAALTAAGLSSCGEDSGNEATPAGKIQQLPPELVPGELLSLRVVQEDMQARLATVKRSYVDAVGFYALRTEDDLLQATLQVTRFNDHADYEDSAFRNQLVHQIGGSLPRRVRLGDNTVYLTRGTQQALAVWFKDRHLLVLATREDYDAPRALLRQALELEL